MPKKKTHQYFYDKLNKADKEERNRVSSLFLIQKEEIEREIILKDYQESFDLEDNDDNNSELIFVRGGVYDVNKKTETLDENKGMIYNFKGVNTDSKYKFKVNNYKASTTQIIKNTPNENKFNAEIKSISKGKLKLKSRKKEEY